MELRIISINVNSIVNYGRKYLLNEFITRNPAHIYFVQETKFGEKHQFSFPSFATFTSSLALGTGGVLLMVQCGLKVRNLRTLVGSIDAALVDVLIGNTWITFGSIYIHPTCCELSPLTTLLSNCQHFIIGGDFNARDPAFGDVSANNLGKLLSN